MEFYIHGSEDSLDIDGFFVVDALSPIKNENKILCDRLSKETGMNGNIITIDRDKGVVTGVYKGTIDEVNNSLLRTYPLHVQSFACPIKTTLPRDVIQKQIRVLRGVLSHCSRTTHRKDVKRALHSENLYEKLEVLKSIDLVAINDYVKNPIIEVHKFMVFQFVQALALRNYEEVYTKSEAVNYYPAVEPFIYRRGFGNGAPEILNDLKDIFVEMGATVGDFFDRVSADGKTIFTPFGTLNVLTEQYEES